MTCWLWPVQRYIAFCMPPQSLSLLLTLHAMSYGLCTGWVQTSTWSGVWVWVWVGLCAHGCVCVVLSGLFIWVCVRVRCVVLLAALLMWVCKLVHVCVYVGVFAGMCHTVIWDVQYGKIRVTYGIRVYNTIVFLSNFRSADFWPKLDPIRPKITQNVSNSFPTYYKLFIYYIIALEAHWKIVVGAEIA
jgi:hypothetical protein